MNFPRPRPDILTSDHHRFDASDFNVDPSLWEGLTLTQQRWLFKLLAENARLRRSHESRQRSLIHLDQMTGVESQQHFDSTVLPELNCYLHEVNARAFPSSYVVGIADINGSRKLNDTIGKQGMDRTIRATAAAIRGAIKQTDVLWRCGEQSDEFGIVLRLRQSDPKDVQHVIGLVQERIHLTLAESFPTTRSVSLGFAHIRKGVFSSVDEALLLADAEMQCAKGEYYKSAATIGRKATSSATVD